MVTATILLSSATHRRWFTTKHRAYQEIAQSNSGMLGRTPDFLNTGMAVLAERAAFLGQNQYTDFAANAPITLRRSS